MKQYKTYQEAKIENPSCEVFRLSPHDLTKDECFFAGKAGHGQLIDVGAVFRCNPADYCMTLEQFFEAGHKLVDGDVYLSSAGSVIRILSSEMLLTNGVTLRNADKCYILRAKALEKSDPEWANGDELPQFGSICEILPPDGDWFEVEIAAHCKDCDGDDVIFYRNHNSQTSEKDYDWCYAASVKFRKPEAPEDKAKREALELLNPDSYGPMHSMVEAVVEKLSNAGMLKSKGEK